MGADAWVACPACDGLKKELRNHKEKYGKISAEDYDILCDEVEEQKGKQTVGIYQETNLNADRSIDFSLGATCDVCGMKWEITKKNLR